MKSLNLKLLLILLFSSSLAFAGVSGENNPATDTGAAQAVNSGDDYEFFSIPFAFGYIVDMAEDTTERKPWWARLKIGFQNDDNVIMNSKDVPLPPDVPKKDDLRLVANFNGKYMFYKGSWFEAAATYSLFQSLHNDLDDYDVTQNMAELYGEFNIVPAVDLKLIYTFHHMAVGGDRFDTANMVGPKFVIRESDEFVTHIEYKFRDTEYEELSHFEYNSERTGENNYVGIIQYVAFSTPALLRLGYSREEEKTRQEFLDFTGDKIMVGLSYMPSLKLLMDFCWEYNKRDYEEVNPYTNVKRDDTTSVVTLTSTHNLSERYNLIVRIYYMQNDSNVEDFDVTRFVPGLMLEMKY